MGDTGDKPLRVLVVDDDADCRDLFSQITNSDERFRVTAQCSTTQDLSRHLQSDDFDVIITDIMLGDSASEQPLTLVTNYCLHNPRTVVLVVSSLSSVPISRSIPHAIRHRFAFVPKSSSLNAHSILGGIEDLLSAQDVHA